MRLHKRKKDFRAMSDINIANLVDVVLVLLIIFMISAPLLQSGIEVNLPKTKAAAVTEQSEGIIITIDDKGGIYVNDVWTRIDNFSDRLKKAIDEKGTSTVYLRADSMVYYGVAIDVISQLKENGIIDIGLVTTQENK